MKIAPLDLDRDQAHKQLKLFAILGLLASIVSLLFLWWLAIAGIAFSARALLLTWHKGTLEKRIFYRLFATAGLAMGALGLGVHYFITS